MKKKSLKNPITNRLRMVHKILSKDVYSPRPLTLEDDSPIALKSMEALQLTPISLRLLNELQWKLHMHKGR